MLLVRLLVPLFFLDIAAPLQCLHKYYAVAVDAAGATLPDGTHLAYDDGKTKSPEERLEHPDLHDMFAQRYAPGAIAAVTTPDWDPGRARVEPLFAALYPHKDVVRLPFLDGEITVHARAKAAFLRVGQRLHELLAAQPSLKKFVHPLGGTLNVRKIAGTDRTSAHAWGIAIDLNPSLSSYWRWEKGGGWRNQIPQPIVDAFEAEGFIWGGRWSHFDTMHFEWRPELVDQSCYARPQSKP
jgi:hypothetical protein